jgi:diadenosine tetraphosphate (Ap4A) HIT family hydrolase
MDSKPDCELCGQAGGSLIWQDDACRVVLVADADYPGFCRVIWKQHVKEMTDLSFAEREHLMATVFAVEAAIREVMHPDKINLASLGNMTPHLHWHVIPRFMQDKHFPQPIWGTPQREGKQILPPDLAYRMVNCVRSKLSNQA